jgi:hypothetical protein
MSLPSHESAETIKDLATAAGILLGGGWAFWRWTFSEYLRRGREMPSIDGEITVRSVLIDDESELITVSCNWRNVSAIPLNVNTKETR